MNDEYGSRVIVHGFTVKIVDRILSRRMPETLNPTKNKKRLSVGDKYVNMCEMKNTRPVSWIKAARKDFEDFPVLVQHDMLTALTIAAEGEKSDNAKPFRGIDGGVFEIAFRHRGDAFRVIYALKMGADVWVIHAFQKKSKIGIKTPQIERDLIRERLRQLKEALK